MNDDPLVFAVKTVLSTRISTRLYVTNLLQENTDDIQMECDELRNDVLNSI